MNDNLLKNLAWLLPNSKLKIKKCSDEVSNKIIPKTTSTSGSLFSPSEKAFIEHFCLGFDSVDSIHKTIFELNGCQDKKEFSSLGWGS